MSTEVQPGMTEEEFLAADPEDGMTPDGDSEQELIQTAIETLVDYYDTQERSTRNQQLRLWKYLELLWSGSGNYYWNHINNQWRTVTQEDIALLSQDVDIDPTLLNKVINLIRPYGESLAGVLTTGTPTVKFFPEDADKEEDIIAAKAYHNVEKKIRKDNYMTIRLIEMLVKLWNGGFACIYNYTHTDDKYGVTQEEIFEERPHSQGSLICIECGEEVLSEPEPKVDDTTEEKAEGVSKSIDEQLDPEKPEKLGNTSPEPPPMVEGYCENCDDLTLQMKSEVDAGMQSTQVGMQDIPKSREIVEVYGPMNIKIPAMATKEEDVIFLFKEEEKHISQARSMFPDHKNNIEPGTTSDIDIDRINRASYEIGEDTLVNYVTIRWCWFRPSAYEALEDDKQVELLNRKYPLGIKAIFSTDTYLEAEEEDIDAHWSITINPLYNRIQADPLGKALIGLHETANDLFQLEVDTVRHAIPETFADPQYLDFESRAQSRARPGNISPMTRPPGGRLQDNLAETKTATLPREVENLDIKTEKLLQFISGILPSVFGGPASGSKTLGEYQESKNQALQRLSIIWKVVAVVYTKLMAKATKAYVDNLRDDERLVEEQGQGNFVNVWIRKTDFDGKIGEVEPELTEQFPSTWGQISGRVMELLGMNNQAITSWFLHPENVQLIYKVIGIDELFIPGEDQRNKQLYEISQLMMSEPIEPEADPLTGQPLVDEMTGQPMMPQPSVPIQPIDEHQYHMSTIQAYLNSPAGIEMQNVNQAGYANVMLHYQAHQAAMMEQQMAAQEEEGVESQSEEVEEV